MKDSASRCEVEALDRSKTAYLCVVFAGMLAAAFHGGLWFDSFFAGMTILSVLAFIWGLVLLAVLVAKDWKAER